MNCDVCDRPECSWDKHDLVWKYLPYNEKKKEERGPNLEYLQTWRIVKTRKGTEDWTQQNDNYCMTKMLALGGWWGSSWFIPGTNEMLTQEVLKDMFLSLLEQGAKETPFMENETTIWFDIEGWKK